MTPKADGRAFPSGRAQLAFHVANSRRLAIVPQAVNSIR
jgi:hypothetical protein